MGVDWINGIVAFFNGDKMDNSYWRSFPSTCSGMGYPTIIVKMGSPTAGTNSMVSSSPTANSETAILQESCRQLRLQIYSGLLCTCTSILDPKRARPKQYTLYTNY